MGDNSITRTKAKVYSGPTPGVEHRGGDLNLLVRAPRDGAHKSCHHDGKDRLVAHDALRNYGGARRHQNEHSMMGKERQLDIAKYFRVCHDILHQRIVVLNNLVRLIPGALASGIETNDDGNVIQNLGRHASSKLIIDDKNVDAAFLNRSSELFLRGADIE